jgi:hypothetical protein
MYKTDWKTKQDRWALYAALHQLELSNIPYVVILDAIGIKDTCPWLAGKNYIDNFDSFQIAYNQRLDLHKKGKDWQDPGYHTLPEDQVNISDELLAHIKKYQLLSI